ncbi:hypothetical protein MNBD_DELTA03-948 [hydrothermal vent metagenome]|uniref:PIN domain-containing protein n=1 Tax=hydrothermal vent metagenome TaxID=652676 RepID=A0A3B0W4N1_9ZZZZ
MKYLLDINVISEPVKGQPDSGVVDQIKGHRDQLAIAAVVWHELKFGLYRLPPCRKRDILFKYLHEVIAPNLPILPYDEKAAAWHAEERARLAAIGKTPPFADSQIAAIAVSNNLILVTRNTSDFLSFNRLMTENWHT